MTSPGQQLSPVARPPGDESRGVVALLDVAVGAGLTGLAVASAARRRVDAAVRPLARPLIGPPLRVVRRLPVAPVAWLSDLAGRGGERRVEARQELSALLDLLVPVVLDTLLRRIDLTALVRDHVDLNAIVAEVDLDAAVEGVDLDAVASRLDLAALITRIDLDAVVAEQLDLDAVVARVDLDAAVGRVDLDAVVARIDLVALTEEILAAVDLPEIIRESTGSMASDTVRGVRMHGITADEVIARAVDRLRRRSGSTPAIDPPGGSP